MIPPQQENNAIANRALDKTLPQENNIVSAEAEWHKNIESELNDNDLYYIDNMSRDDKKENSEWRKYAFEKKIENSNEVEI